MAAVSIFTASSLSDKSSGGQENWQDANSALAELDKGLRSTKGGDQCEAIVRFPSLFEKYPFPILINSAFLKLADVFRIGNNFLRLCVLKVTQQSGKHLDKILNVDEFLRRIYAVIHSNDPIARAITVRVLGSIASIIAERKNVHHSIRSSLDSHDQVELEAAIFATSQFCAQSSDFAAGICNKIAEMIQGLTTPVEMKLKLIPIFKYMFHEVQLSNRVRELCSSLLKSYTACRFVLITLHTLSCLSSSSVIDIPDQVNLLLTYLKNDPRKVVKCQVLKDLKLLAQKAPHMWQPDHVENLCSFLLETCFDSLKLGGLLTLVTLSRTIAVEHLNQVKVLEVCSQETNSSNLAVAALSTELLTHIATARVKIDSDDVVLCEEASTSLETTVVLCCVDEQVEPLKVCLSSMNYLIDSYPRSAASLVRSLTSLLPATGGDIALEVCHALVTIATQIPSVLVPQRLDIRQQFCSVISQHNQPLGRCEDEALNNIVVALATLMFQSHQCTSGENEATASQSNVKELILTQLKLLSSPSRYWTTFRVGRQAMRQGFHDIASTIFDELTAKLASEHFYFWLSALKSFCEAESTITKPCSTQVELVQQISESCNKYHKGLVALKAAVTPTHQLTFERTYAKLRTDMLQTHNQLLAACASMKSCPPPAIATAVAMATGQGVHSLSHFASQMSECSRLYRGLGESYGNLYQSSFDADPASLQTVQTLQQCCLLLSTGIELLMKNTPPSFPGAAVESSGSLQTPLATACKYVLEAFQSFAIQLESTPVCHLQTEGICKASMTLLQVPFTFPKYFFQSQQSTVIKLALSPVPRMPSEPLVSPLDSQFALKVEGVIEHGQNPVSLPVAPCAFLGRFELETAQDFTWSNRRRHCTRRFRKVQSVCLHVTSRPEDRKQYTADLKVARENINNLEQTVEPHNDYFSAQFLLSFTTATVHTVTVTTSVIDDTGARWEIGPQSSMLVKTCETPSRSRSGSSRS